MSDCGCEKIHSDTPEVGRFVGGCKQQDINRRTYLEHATLWRRFSALSPGLFIPQTGTPVIYYSKMEPNGAALDRVEYKIGREGVACFDCPGDWWFNLPLAGSVAANVDYKFLPISDPAALKAAMVVYGLSDPVDVLRWGGVLVQGAGDFGSVAADEDVRVPWVRASLTAFDASQAAASRNVPIASRANSSDGLVANTDQGLVANARHIVTRGSNGTAVRLLADVLSAINGEGAATNYYLRQAAVMVGRDMGDSTLRVIEGRNMDAAADVAAALYGITANARLAANRVESGDYDRLRMDFADYWNNGRAPSVFGALHALALDMKRDSDGTLLTPTEMNRTVTGSAVNPAAAVIATLDARGLTNKSFSVTDTAIGTYAVEFSYEGTTYDAPAEFAGLATIVGTVMASNRAIEVAKGFRYIRIRATEAAGTVTVRMSAQGA